VSGPAAISAALRLSRHTPANSTISSLFDVNIFRAIGGVSNPERKPGQQRGEGGRFVHVRVNPGWNLSCGLRTPVDGQGRGALRLDSCMHTYHPALSSACLVQALGVNKTLRRHTRSAVVSLTFIHDSVDNFCRDMVWDIVHGFAVPVWHVGSTPTLVQLARHWTCSDASREKKNFGEENTRKLGFDK